MRAEGREERGEEERRREMERERKKKKRNLNMLTGEGLLVVLPHGNEVSQAGVELLHDGL